MNILDINKKFRPTMRIYAFSWEAWCLISRTEGEVRGSPRRELPTALPRTRIFPNDRSKFACGTCGGPLDDDIGMIRALKVPGTQGTGREPGDFQLKGSHLSFKF